MCAPSVAPRVYFATPSYFSPKVGTTRFKVIYLVYRGEKPLEPVKEPTNLAVRCGLNQISCRVVDILIFALVTSFVLLLVGLTNLSIILVSRQRGGGE